MNSQSLTNLSPITYENPGGLIRADRWNANFTNIIDTVNANNITLKSNFDSIIASAIPSTAIIDIGQQEESNVFDQLLLISSILTTKLSEADIGNYTGTSINNASYDSSNGVFTFTQNNGNTITIDTNIEKIPARLELVEEDGEHYLVITNDDGSTTRTNVSSLFNVYTFLASSTITPSTDGYSVTFNINDGSITRSKLASDLTEYLDSCVTSASASATSANTSKTEAHDYAELAKSYSEASASSASSSQLYAGDAETYATNASNSASSSANYANNSSTSATNAAASESKAKYWADRAQEIVGGDYVTHTEYAADMAGKQDKLTFDNAPTDGSNNPVKSNGIYDALTTKQNTLTFDDTPTASSTNPVTSGGVKTALDTKQDVLTIDSTPTSDSTNPISSGGAYTALQGKQDVLTFDNTPTANSSNPVKSSGIKTAIDAKQKKAKTVRATLTVAGWENVISTEPVPTKYIQTVTVTGVTTTSILIVSPTGYLIDAYGNAEIRATQQGTNSVTFECVTKPTEDITVNIVIL